MMASGAMMTAVQLLPVLVLGSIALGQVKLRAWSDGVGCAGGGSAHRQLQRLGELALACALFFGCGPGIIMVNKHIMTKLHFRFPIFITSLGNLCLALASQATARAGIWPTKTLKAPRGSILKVAVPLSIASNASMFLGTSAYMFIPVPLVQILKSVTLVEVMVIGWLMGTEKPSALLATAVCTIVVGISCSVGDGLTVGGGQGPGTFAYGVGIMLLASSSEAMKSVLSQVSIERLAFFDSIYWCSPVMTAIGLALSATLELPTMLGSTEWTPRLVLALASSFFLGGMVSFAGFWLTKLVGGLAMKVLVNARNVGFVLFSVFAFGEECTAAQYVGYSIALVGIALFERAKRVTVAPLPKPTGYNRDHHLRLDRSPVDKTP